MSLVDRVLLFRADEQCRGSRLPPDGRDNWAIGGARKKPGPKGPRSKLLPDEVRRIRRALEGGEPIAHVAKRLNHSKNFIQRVGDRSIYAEVA